MNFLKFIKDVIARKKLIRLHKPWSIKSYDFRREIALFWDTPAYMPENSNKEQYEQLVAVNGVGALSGGSAICDFLAEFEDECTVLGCRALGKTKAYDAKKGDVFEFFYWAKEGSVISLEQTIFSPKTYYNRAGALEFSTFTLRNYYSGIWIFDDYYLQRSKKFLFDLIDCHWRHNSGSIINVINKGKWIKIPEYMPKELPDRIAYDDPYKNQMIKTIFKDMSLKEYRHKARDFFKDWLKHLPSKKFLVCGGLVNIGRYDTALFNDYFDDLKVIYIYRDPRDQYERCRNKNADYTPKDPIMFSKRYRRLISNVFNAKDDNLLIVRLEEFITQYDKVSKQIMDFLGLDPAKHTKKFEFFDPEISGKKIGIHKTYHDQEAIKIIERELKEYCWNK